MSAGIKVSVESLIEYVSTSGRMREKMTSEHGRSDRSGKNDKSLREGSYHSIDNQQGGGRSYHGHPDQASDSWDKNNAKPLSGMDIEISTSQHGSADKLSQHSIVKSTSSGSFTAMIQQLSNIPLHVRGRAEAWETPRNQLKLLEKLGEGECGCVYKCRWRGLDCAAKILTQNSRTSVAYHDMVNEISTVSHLRHPNLVLFLGACTTGDEPLLILNEYMAGGSLEDRFKERWRTLGCAWRPPRPQAMKWIKDLTRAITFLHNCHTPIVHRDLKPANLLLTDEDHLKVADFGLCKTLLKVQEDGTTYQMTGKTGTMRYMAPEVVRSEPYYDEKVDIYSMGMIFWYICHGVRPFEGVQPDLVAELTSQRALRPQMESLRWPELGELIERMWAEKASERPSAASILEQLNRMDTTGGDWMPDEGPVKRTRTKCTVHCQCAVM
mmetsp:Transcript_9277/g.23168  ORF Transcript_9277/g.23168 Transcript_9277/m.23168 type:complete len:439 (-) Transcript_9277:250-1566(-)